MILKFATKRDRNGNRYYLGIDTKNKVYAVTSSHWYSREDFTEVTKKDRRKLIESVKAEGYTEIYSI